MLLPTTALVQAQSKSFHALAFYSTHVEQDHVVFAQQAIAFYQDLARREHFSFDSTTDWNDLNPNVLKNYQVILWLDDFPKEPEQKTAFQNYMEHGGGWLGFHIAGYMARREDWPWFADFLGTVFYGNSWPPMPATLDIADSPGDLTARLPKELVSPANEWYSWNPSPRKSPNIRVIMTLDPKNYPLGFKDTLTGGDIPVTWTNMKYRMIYTNMGHGSKIFDDPLQDDFFARALLWLGRSEQS
jgi:type 1 glutamine amidotransferase